MVRFELEMLIQLCKSARNRISLTCMSTQLFFQSISKFIMRSEKYNSELLILNFASTGVLKIPFSIFVMLCTTLPAFFFTKDEKYSWHGVFTRLEEMCMFSDFFLRHFCSFLNQLPDLGPQSIQARALFSGWNKVSTENNTWILTYK